jgi:outer membrane receptor protein involved in Fe transport
MTPRLAVNAETRKEEFERTGGTTVTLLPSGQVILQPDVQKKDRSIDSLSMELLLPIVKDGKTMLLHGLDVSLAGRFDRYSDFGETFNPQFGFVWSATRSIKLRASYGEAFRAPALADLRSSTVALINRQADPRTGGLTPVLMREGERADLDPEEAKSWSASIDFAPQFAPWIKGSISYFDVDYRDRIGVPSPTGSRATILQREASFATLINRNPTAADIDEILRTMSGAVVANLSVPTFTSTSQGILAAFPNIVIFDDRRVNLSVEKVSGLNFAVDTHFATAAGALSFGLNAAYMLDHEFQISPTSLAIDKLNAPGYLTDFRFRFNAGLNSHGFGVFAYVNYSDGYPNPLSTPRSEVASYTTVDLTFRFVGSDLASSGLLNGFTAALSVDNVLDEGPPLLPEPYGGGVRYDQSNADPFGRTVSLRLAKAF